MLNDIHEYSKNKLFYEHMENDEHQSIDETESYLMKWIDDAKYEKRQLWSIFLKEEGKVIGTVGIWEIDWERKSCGIGYGISPDYWGKGLVKEAVTILLRELFENMKFHRIHGITSVNNIMARIGARQLGFSEEGIMRDYYLLKNGKRVDAIINSILYHEFKQ